MNNFKRFFQNAAICTLTTLSILFFSGCTLTTGPFTKTPSKANADYIEPTTGMGFVFVAGGSFKMGDINGNGNKRERPVHQVAVEDAAVGMYEVTFEEYDKFCEATGREKPSDEGWGRDYRPVINVSWHDATAFAEWLSKKSNQTFSLPSEAQWEYFARAGTTTEHWMGDKVSKETAQCKDCSSKSEATMTAPVGSFPPNPWGIYDTAGNVSEWCQDDHHKDYTGAPDDGRAWSNGKSDRAIHRGDGWSAPSFDLRSANRDRSAKDRVSDRIGFRLITTIPAPPKK